MSLITTFAPSLARANADARPIPEAPAVTRAIFPENYFAIYIPEDCASTRRSIVDGGEVNRRFKILASEVRVQSRLVHILRHIALADRVTRGGSSSS